MPGDSSHQKIKVLHFIWSVNFGGIEKTAIHLAAQQNYGMDIHSEILVGRQKGEYDELIKKFDIPSHSANLNSGYDFQPGKIFRMIRRMRRFDVLHLHTFNPAVMVASILSGKKIVYTVHGNFNFGKKIRVTDRINNFLRTIFLNTSVNLVSFNSEWTRKTARSKFRIHNKKQLVIHNGLFASADEKISASEKNPKKSDKFIVGTASRFNGSKRIDRLIDAFSLFSKGKPDVKLLLVGDGVEMNALKNRVKSNAMDALTEFTGFKPDIDPYLRQMDLCVFPFQNEAFGLVVLEAMNLGKPSVIFNDAGGSLELFGDDFPGDVVASVAELATRMEWYYHSRMHFNTDHSRKLQKRAGQFTIAGMEQKFLAGYKSIL